MRSPLIVTEGKTDTIYLRAAIERQDVFHPALGKPLAGAGFAHALSYIRYGGISQEILDLAGGGTANLRSIPLDYKRNFPTKSKDKKVIVHQPFDHPVIILLDNDTGIEGIASTLKEAFKVQISPETTEPFYHVTKNLYVVKTPEVQGKTCIEHFFPTSVLGHELDKKTLSLDPNFDRTKHFGKDIFATYVVRPQKGIIDFSGFDPLLDRIVQVLVDYAERRTERLQHVPVAAQSRKRRKVEVDA